MGNRSYLYIKCGNGHEQIAAANNNIPHLWQLMLAGATAGEPIRDQRVFWDLNTDNLEVPLVQAVERAQRILAFIAMHPSGALLPALRRASHAVCDYLLQRLGIHGNDATLSACFDELAAMKDDDNEDFAERFVADLREDFTALWEAVRETIARSDAEHFDAVLAWDSRMPGDWSRDGAYWQWQFGLASFETLAMEGGPVFELDKVAEEQDLRQDRHRFGEHGGFGLRRGQGEDAPELLPPIYQAFCNMDAAGGPFDYLIGCKSSGIWALADTRTSPATLVCTPRFDELQPFAEGLARVRIRHHDTWIRPDGTFHTKPYWQNVCDFCGGLGRAMKNGLWGFVDTAGQVRVAPTYLEAEVMAAPVQATFYRVRLASGWGLMDTKGELVLPCEFDAIAWSNELPGWETRAAGRVARFHADGRPWQAP